ncbi:MAG: hypothetical protein QXR19_01920 [Candidatus Jordarchaeaceae archaeon]
MDVSSVSNPMARYDLISTGIPKLDERLGGGILSNSIVLLLHQINFRYWEFINLNMPFLGEKEFYVVIVDYVRPVDDFLYMATTFWRKEEEAQNGKELISFDKIRVIDCFSSQPLNEMLSLRDKVYTLDEPFDTDRLLSLMRSVREGLPSGSWAIWIFGTLTDLSMGISEEEVARFYRRVVRFHKQYGDLAFYMLNMDAHETKFRAILSQLSDVVIQFKVEETGEKLRNYMQVIKAPFPVDTTKLYYDIESDGSIIYY